MVVFKRFPIIIGTIPEPAIDGYLLRLGTHIKLEAPSIILRRIIYGTHPEPKWKIHFMATKGLVQAKLRQTASWFRCEEEHPPGFEGGMATDRCIGWQRHLVVTSNTTSWASCSSPDESWRHSPNLDSENASGSMS